MSRAQAMLADMISAERGASDMEALRAIARRSRVGFWTLHNIKRGRAKSVKDSILDRIEASYLEFCRLQIERWSLQLEIAEATSDVSFDDLRRSVSDVAQKLAHAQEAHRHRSRDGRLRRVPDDDRVISSH